MSTFKDREKGHVGAHVHKEALGFQQEAKACKIFGLWVAEKLGLEGDQADLYAGDVVTANLEEPGFDDVMRKVKPDLHEKGIDISDEILDAELNRALAEVKTTMDNG